MTRLNVKDSSVIAKYLCKKAYDKLRSCFRPITAAVASIVL
jgi:hypothetical protein